MTYQERVKCRRYLCENFLYDLVFSGLYCTKEKEVSMETIKKFYFNDLESILDNPRFFIEETFAHYSGGYQRIPDKVYFNFTEAENEVIRLQEEDDLITEAEDAKQEAEEKLRGLVPKHPKQKFCGRPWYSGYKHFRLGVERNV